MLNKERNDNLESAKATDMSEKLSEETEEQETRKGNWREAFRAAFERARRQHKPAAGRQELGRDKSKAFFVLVGTGVALLLLFFGIFSTPKKRTQLPGGPGTANPASGARQLRDRKTGIPRKRRPPCSTRMSTRPTPAKPDR